MRYSSLLSIFGTILVSGTILGGAIGGICDYTFGSLNNKDLIEQELIQVRRMRNEDLLKKYSDNSTITPEELRINITEDINRQRTEEFNKRGIYDRTHNGIFLGSGLGLILTGALTINAFNQKSGNARCYMADGKIHSSSD